MDETLLTYEDAAAFLKVKVRTIRGLVARRKLRVISFSHSTKRFRRAWLEEDMRRLTLRAI